MLLGEECVAVVWEVEVDAVVVDDWSSIGEISTRSATGALNIESVKRGSSKVEVKVSIVVVERVGFVVEEEVVVIVLFVGVLVAVVVVVVVKLEDA
jgi:hypothetical protein